MARVLIHSLPAGTSKGAIVRLVCDSCEIDGRRLGAIDLVGTKASVEVPAGWEVRVARAIDGLSYRGRRLSALAEPAAGGPGHDEHFKRLADLLEEESKAQARRTAERIGGLQSDRAVGRGDALTRLVIVEESLEMGGLTLVELAPRTQGQPLPWTRLSAGTPVLLSAVPDSPQTRYRGVVTNRSLTRLCVAVAQSPEVDVEEWRVDLADDETALERQRDALARAAAARGDRPGELREVLLGLRPPEFCDAQPAVPFNESLNESQVEAVRHALSAKDLAVIHGPPGTGKTTALVELIGQSVARGERVLACAPSNLAVDHLLLQLIERGMDVVRLGHPARISPELSNRSLAELVRRHDDVKLARQLVLESQALFRRSGRFTRARPERGERDAQRREARELLADARRLEAQAVDQVLDGTSVVGATLTGLDPNVLGARRFDLAVIDEAAQATEPASWIPIGRCERLVLAGDHCQLPPTVVSSNAARCGLAMSLMERLQPILGSAVFRRLNVQYRMHAQIMDFSNEEFYGGTLVAAEAVAGRLLCDLPGVAVAESTRRVMELIDSAGAGFDEVEEPDGESRLNPSEAEVVCRLADQFVSMGVPPSDVAVISPYAAQVRLLRERLSDPRIEVDSVDGFQGREKEVVLISLVRSNREGQIGFLSDHRRMNVAITRARCRLVLVGDSATLASDPFYGRLLEYVERRGTYRTAWET